MADINDWFGSGSQLSAGLKDGVDTISQYQTIKFTKYVRLVLPIDHYVYWVRSDLLSASALRNTSTYNSFLYNSAPSIVTPAKTIEVRGSFHYVTEQNQDAEQTMAINNVIFTSESEIQEFNQIASNVLFIGEFDGIRFAFNRRESFYKQAGLHHYRGNAIYSIMQSQIIDRPEDFDVSNVIVSNSLPFWLALNELMPVYPAYLVPENIEPVFASVNIDPENTIPLQAYPLFFPDGTQSQLVQDTVKVTLYGMRNFNVLDYINYVQEFCESHPDDMGVSNMPIPRDERKTQSEMNVIAMKKSIVFKVNYHQIRARNIARKLIIEAIPAIYEGNKLIQSSPISH